MKKLIWLSVAGIIALGAAGCGNHKKPTFTYMPDMAYSPALKAQEPGSMQMPPAGTVPRDFQRYQFANDPEGAGQQLRNPLRRTRENLLRGKEQFRIYCGVCHGPEGQGDGSIVPKFPRPPSLTSEKVANWPDGRIFHVITAGQNLMPSYAHQIEPEDRWAIVHFLRVLYRAQNPSAADLKKAENF